MAHKVLTQVLFGPPLKKMFKKVLKAEIYFDPEAQDFEEDKVVFRNAELTPGGSNETEL